MREIKGLVSISIPFYNSERFLAEAIDSVVAQTYANWELLLVDDGSTDGSTEIAREYAANSNGHIRYLEHPGHRNRGVNAARNLGAHSSKGEFLAFLDSDDVLLPEKLEDQIALMSAHPESGMIFGATEYWYDWDISASPQATNQIPPLVPGGQLYSPPALLTMSYPLGKFGAPCIQSFLIRRSAFDCVGGFDECFGPETFQLFEDIAFLSKIYLAFPVFVSARCLDRYRCHSTSMWHSAQGGDIEESARRFYFDWLKQYLKDHSIADPAIWRAVRKESWAYHLPLSPSLVRLARRIANRLQRDLAR